MEECEFITTPANTTIKKYIHYIYIYMYIYIYIRMHIYMHEYMCMSLVVRLLSFIAFNSSER